MVTTDPSSLARLSQECLADNKRWFPTRQGSLFYHVACMAGEAGEVINIVKKVERGTLELNPKVRNEIAEELADVFTYLLGAAGILGVDLEKAYRYKRMINERRFGNNGQPS